MIKRKNKKILKRVLPSVFDGNTLSINIFLFLAIAGFFIAGFDLSTELAREKKEVNFVLDNLEDACNIPQLSPKGLGDITLDLVQVIYTIDQNHDSCYHLTSVDDRGPPVLA